MNQWRKGIASWKVGKLLYISVPFTWLMHEAEMLAESHSGAYLIGGPGTMNNLPCEDFEPLLFHNPLATFTTRGCPNKCSFCAVPKLEGDFRQLDTWRPAPVICDNNLLNSTMTHFYKVIQSLKPFYTCDFNQGLDARLFKKKHAELISTLRHPMVRFSFDHVNMESVVHNAIEVCRGQGIKDFGVYVLIGYKDTPDDSKYRLEKVRSWGVMPNPMRYQPLDATEKNSYVDPNWTELELRNMTRYYSRLNWHGHFSYEQYRHYPLPLFEQVNC